VDAAHDGDTIALSGTYAGGVTITRSVHLVGTLGTVIQGGGPVLTIGRLFQLHPPTVTIDNVFISGGVTTSSPESAVFTGEDGVIANGGGIEIPPGARFTPGATVVIRHSTIIHNLVQPDHTLPLGPPCPGGPCPFAAAHGGGIDNWGNLTVENSQISNNEVSGIASDADGGAISSWMGSVTLKGVQVVNNRAIAVAPDGRFAEGGGLFVNGGTLVVRGSDVSRNRASLTSSLPARGSDGEVIDSNANGGGIHVGDSVPVTITDSVIDGNAVDVSNPQGEAFAFDSGMLMGDGPLTMRDVTISGNTMTSDTGDSVDVGPGGTALEVDGGGRISRLHLTGNTASARSADGTAAVSNGLAVLTSDGPAQLLTVSDSVIEGNTATASSTNGAAVAQGGGILNNALLLLRRVHVSNNAVTADGPSGAAEGGGIWNGVLLTGPPVELTLQHTRVVHNTASGSGGVTIRGGGLFTSEDVTIQRSVLRHNHPDDCFGAPCS
jgi:hypothetical protein